MITNPIFAVSVNPGGSIGELNNTIDGSIVSTLNDGNPYVAVKNAGTIATLSNSGVITGIGAAA